MIILIRSIGFFVIFLGVTVLVSPRFLKEMIAFTKEGKRLYFSIVIKSSCGLAFFLASPQCRLEEVIRVLGLLYLVAPIAVLPLGLEKLKRYCEWWERRPVLVFRLWAVVTTALGGLIVYAV